MTRAAADCQDHDLAEECRGIGTSAIIDTEIDGAAGMNSGIFNNPFMIWGGGIAAGRFGTSSRFPFSFTIRRGMAHTPDVLANLQREICSLR